MPQVEPRLCLPHTRIWRRKICDTSKWQIFRITKTKVLLNLRSRFLKNPVVEEFTTEKLKTLWEKGKKALGVPVYKLTKYL